MNVLLIDDHDSRRESLKNRLAGLHIQIHEISPEYIESDAIDQADILIVFNRT